jgi:hypothetical protein
MPNIPTFDESLPDVHLAGVPEASPAAMGAAGEGLASAGARISDELLQFNEKYQDAKRSEAAATNMADKTKRLGDLEHQQSLVDDRQKALAGYDKGVDTIRGEIAQIPDFRERAIVSDAFESEAASRRISTGQASFGREVSRVTGALQDRQEMYLDQYAAAGQAGNAHLQAIIKDRQKNDVDAIVAGGWVTGEDGEKYKREFGSTSQAEDIRQQALKFERAGDWHSIDLLDQDVANTANYQGLLQKDRETLDWRLQNMSYKLERREQEAETKAQAAAHRQLIENLELAANGDTPAPMTDEQYALAAPDDPKGAKDAVQLAGATANVKQSMALTPLSEDLARLKNFDPNGVFTPPPNADPRDVLAYQRYGKQYYRALQKSVTDKIAALNNDPAGYLQTESPEVRAAFEAGQQDPAKMRDYYALLDATYNKIGIPPASRTLLPKASAEGIAADLAANPELVPGKLQEMQARWGPTYYQRAMQDVVRDGGLPTTVQTIGMLDNHDDAALLAHYMAGRKVGPDGKVALKTDLLPEGEETKISNAVLGNPTLQKFGRAMLQQGSPQQIKGIMEGVVALAYAMRLYRNDTMAAQHAVDSFMSDTKFHETSGAIAYAPAEKMVATERAAQTVIDNLTLDHIRVPAVFGAGKDQRKPQEYIDAIKANPRWVQSTNGGWWWLKDDAGRLVTDKQGNYIAVPIGGGSGLAVRAPAKPQAAPPAPVPAPGQPFTSPDALQHALEGGQ